MSRPPPAGEDRRMEGHDGRYSKDKCKQCLLCVPFCPDSSIPVSGGRRTDFDFDHCKGCGICVKVCPFDAIDYVKEEK